ncbi:FKBP-type peptidyl-prolyl cis-trans isomerase [Vibrio splendidus]
MKQALTDVISERLKNAFLANFILSWCIVNHLVIFHLLLSEDSPNKKLEYIQDLTFSFTTDLLYPLILVFIYTYLLPLINLGLLKAKLRFIEPLLTNYKNDEQSFHYSSKIQIEDKRLDLSFREKERELELEERRTEKQLLRTKAAESEARSYEEKLRFEEKALAFERDKRSELEKVVTLENIAEKESLLKKREALLEHEKNRLENIQLKYTLLKNHAVWVPSNKEISPQDRVVISFVGSINGLEFEGGKADHFILEMGEGHMTPGFEEALIGRHTGENLRIPIEFPDDYHTHDLRGKSAKFSITINKVESKMIPYENL